MTNTVTEFLAKPTVDKFEALEDKGQALRLLRGLPKTSERQYFLYKRGEGISPVKLFKLMLSEKEGENSNLYSLVDDVADDLNILQNMKSGELMKCKSDLDEMAMAAAQFGNKALVLYLISGGACDGLCGNDLNSLALHAAQFGHVSIIDIVDRFDENKDPENIKHLKQLAEQSRIINNKISSLTDDEIERKVFTIKVA